MDSLSLIEFTYDISWHATIKMIPFEVSHGHRCTDKILLGPELVERTVLVIALTRQRMLTAQGRQEFCADQISRSVDFGLVARYFSEYRHPRKLSSSVSVGGLTLATWDHSRFWLE